METVQSHENSMRCLYCRKQIGTVRRLFDREFCSSEHRKRFHTSSARALRDAGELIGGEYDDYLAVLQQPKKSKAGAKFGIFTAASVGLIIGLSFWIVPSGPAPAQTSELRYTVSTNPLGQKLRSYITETSRINLKHDFSMGVGEWVGSAKAMAAGGALQTGGLRLWKPTLQLSDYQFDFQTSIQKKAEFCMRWLDSIQSLDRLGSVEDRKRFLLNLICFAACIEGLFFFGAFAYVYFLRSRGLLHGLAAGTNWVFRDESAHMAFAFEVVDTVRREEPGLFDAELTADVYAMIDDAIECEAQFAEDLLAGGVVGLSVRDVKEYLRYCADQRLARLGMAKRYHTKNPLAFMDLQDVQEVTNFFERRVSAYQVGVSGEVVLDAAF